MSDELSNIRVAVLAADGVEQVELEQPRDAVTRAGAQVTLVSLRDGQIQAMNHDIEPGAKFDVDAQLSEVSPDDFDALILPGGTVNPDNLRASKQAVDFVRSFATSGKLVAAICHGPWTLVEADVVRGRTLTSYPSIRTDIRNAGGNVVDEEVATDGNLITSRNPDDLPAFCAAIVSRLSRTSAG